MHEVRTVESTLEHGQLILKAFLDLQGGFNNVSTTAITNSQKSIEIS